MTHFEHFEADFEAGLEELQAKHSCLSQEVDWLTAIDVLACVRYALDQPEVLAEATGAAERWADELLDRIEEASPRLGRALRDAFANQE